MSDFGACEETTKQPILVLEENRCKIIFNNKNNKEIRKVIIDGCVLKEGVRCDYLVIVDNIENFVELKGADVRHAIDQIKTTIIKVSSNVRKTLKNSYIVSTKCPISSTDIQKIQKFFYKEYNSNFFIKKLKSEVNL